VNAPMQMSNTVSKKEIYFATANESAEMMNVPGTIATGPY